MWLKSADHTFASEGFAVTSQHPLAMEKLKKPEEENSGKSSRDRFEVQDYGYFHSL